jgi:hypothetical protein
MNENNESPIPGLESDPVYLQLNPKVRQGVNEGIRAELEGIALDRNLSSAQKELYRKHYLDVKVPSFLENMLDGQTANERMAEKHRQKAGCGPLEHAAREPEARNR